MKKISALLILTVVLTGLSCTKKFVVQPLAPGAAPTATDTPVWTLTQTPTPSSIPTNTITATFSFTPVPTGTPTDSMTPMATVTGTVTLTTSPTLTPTLLPTATPTRTFIPPPTATRTYTGTPGSATATPTGTWTCTVTNTPLNTATLIPCSAFTTLGSLGANAAVFYSGDNLLLTKSFVYWQSNVVQISASLQEHMFNASNLYMVIYDDNGNYPGNLIYASGPIYIPQNSSYTSTTVTCNPNLSILPGNYWIGYWGGGDGYVVCAMDHTSGTGPFVRHGSCATLPGTVPPYFSPNDSQASYRLSISWVVCHLPTVTPTNTVTPTFTWTPTQTLTPTGTIPTATRTVTPTPT